MGIILLAAFSCFFLIISENIFDVQISFILLLSLNRFEILGYVFPRVDWVGWVAVLSSNTFVA